MSNALRCSTRRGPRTLAEAEVFKGAKVYKQFDSGWWHGRVKDVYEGEYNDLNTGKKIFGILYFVRYTDGDTEDLDWLGLQPILVNKPEGMNEHHLGSPALAEMSNEQGTVHSAHGRKRNRAAQLAEQRPASSNEENASNADVRDADFRDADVREPGRRRGPKRVACNATISPGPPATDAAEPSHAAAAAAAAAAPTHKTKSRLGSKHVQQEDEHADPDAQGGELQEQAEQEEEEAHAPRSKRRRSSKENRVQSDAILPHAPAGPSLQPTDVGQAAAVELDQPAVTQSLALRSEGLPGHLYRIKLENFMCHKNFEVLFKLNMNFVSGENGSGKSAVLQGMQCCLGAAARQTGRAANMSGFIRTGEHEARVLTTLWNTGEEAYKPELFGRFITVERRIRSSGSSEFRLLDQNMRCRETSRAALEGLLDHMNIDCANPLSVMTQDCARNFLAGQAGDKDKYALFMQGTSLQLTENRIQQAQGTVVRIEDEIRKSKETLSKDAQDEQQVSKKIAQLEEADTWVLQLEQTENLMIWTPYNKACADLEAQQRACAQLEECLVELAGVEQEAAAEVEALTKARAEGNEEIRRCKDRIQELVESSHQLRQQRDEADRDVIYYERIGQQKRRELDEAVAVEQDVAAVLQGDDNQEAHNQMVEQSQREIKECQEEAERLKAAHEAAKQHFKRAYDRATQLKDQFDEKQRDLEGARQQLQAAQQEHQDWTRSQGNRVQRFGGAAAQRIRQLIHENRRRFQQLPIGPIGALLSLRDERWATAVEAHIGSNLDTFICDNHADSKQLTALCQQHNIRVPNLTTVPFSIPQHNIAPHKEPPPHVMTTLRAIQCTDPAVQHVVMNILVDHNKVEATALVGGMQEASDMMHNPQYSAATTVYQTQPRFVVWKRNGASVSTQPLKSVRTARLAANTAGQLEQLAAEVQRVQGVVSSLQNELAVLGEQHREAMAECEAAEKANRSAHNAYAKKHHQGKQLVHALESTLREQSAASQSTNVTAQLDLVRTQITRLRSEFEENQQRLDEARQQRDDLAQRLQNAAGSEAEQLDARSEQQHQLVNQIGEQLKAAKGTLRTVQEAKAKHQQQLEKCRTEVAWLEGLKQETRALAEEHCPEDEAGHSWRALEPRFIERVAEKVRRKPENQGLAPEQLRARLLHTAQQVMRDYENLTRSCGMLAKRIKDAENEAGGDLTELQARQEALRRRISQRRGKQDRVRLLYHKVRDIVKQRWQGFIQKRDAIARNINQQFYKNMKKKGHTGNIEFDFDNQKIVLAVTMNSAAGKGADKAAKKPVVTDLRSLSGGEKSYTTVCFILAIAEYCESPFRCMDEYDVFMDAVVRRITTEALFDYALEHKDTQYILLSPQNMTLVDEAVKQLEKRRGHKLPPGFRHNIQMPKPRDTTYR